MKHPLNIYRSDRKHRCLRKRKIQNKPQTNIWSNLCGLPGLGGWWWWWWGHVGGVSNAPRTVGTLGRGELSPPIKITD